MFTARAIAYSATHWTVLRGESLQELHIRTGKFGRIVAVDVALADYFAFVSDELDQFRASSKGARQVRLSRDVIDNDVALASNGAPADTHPPAG